jgi:hypothetical protein
MVSPSELLPVFGAVVEVIHTVLLPVRNQTFWGLGPRGQLPAVEMASETFSVPSSPSPHFGLA